MTGFAIFCGCLALCGWIYLAFFNGGFWQLLFDKPPLKPGNWPSVDIIVPARNEAEVLPQSLPLLLAQDYPGKWRIILVDDNSEDGTGKRAYRIAADHKRTDHLIVIDAPALLKGWSGKLAAMQVAVAQSDGDYLLFTDADIAHPKDSLRHLVGHAMEKKLDLISRMVELNCQSRVEKLLIPAFVFFFTMLYPFRRANDERSHVAAAAGGVVLVRRMALNNIGGLARIKSALIDDCALARAVKYHGGPHETPGRIELTLTRDIQSLRPCPHLKDIWRMVARTAYTQLQHSPSLLAGTVLAMVLLFLAPIFLVFTGLPLAAETGLAAWVIMTILYMPMVHFYRRPYLWALSLPLAALIFMGATIDSARLYWQGKGGQWKGRSQA